MRKITYILLCVVCACVFTNCSRDIAYCHFVPVSSEQWHMDSIARFDFSIEDADADYQMILYLRHTDRFPYQNMWIYATEKETQDTIEFYLADDRGQWLGDKKHGFIEMPVLLEENRHFADTGRYSLEIQHGMRDTLLRGVTDVGLEIRRNGEK